MRAFTIRVLQGEEFDTVAPLVGKLLEELGEEGDDTGMLDVEAVKRAWHGANLSLTFIASSSDKQLVGIATVVECFAIYANGNYGVINEMYVVPEFRSQRVGASLIEEICSVGKRRGWSRIDVTAPESERWARTRRFYEQNGFKYTGPKLKLRLD